MKRQYRKHNKDTNHPDFPHGEFAGYRAGCKCEGCNSANNDKKRVKYQNAHPKLHKKTKVCKICNEEKLLDEFYLHSEDKWPESNCKKCAKVLRREYRLKKDYGISCKEYDRMYEQQQGHCTICELPFTEKNIACIDHCHKTGVVRGLLHARCNQALGIMYDNPKICQNAANYLARFNDHPEREYTQASGSA